MRTLIAISAFLMLLSGGGCAPTNVVDTRQIYDPNDIDQRYYQRVDKVTLTAGNAKEVNSRIHEVDPWPRYVANTRIPANGERMARAVERYRKAGPRPLPTESTSGVSAVGGGGGGGGGGAVAQ